MRRAVNLMVDRVVCDAPCSVVRILRITIDVKVREAATIHVDTDTMARFEEVGRRLKRKLEQVDLPVFHQACLLEPVSIPRPENAFRDRERITDRIVGSARMNVDHLYEEIGVRRIG